MNTKLTNSLIEGLSGLHIERWFLDDILIDGTSSYAKVFGYDEPRKCQYLPHILLQIFHLFCTCTRTQNTYPISETISTLSSVIILSVIILFER